MKYKLDKKHAEILRVLLAAPEGVARLRLENVKKMPYLARRGFVNIAGDDPFALITITDEGKSALRKHDRK